MELKRYPDRALRKKCLPVRDVDDEFVSRAQQMLEFMYAAEGLGLAAPQVGRTDRIVTLDVAQQREGTRIFLNPRIVSHEGYMEEEEGCLSLPGIRVKVPSAEKVAVRAFLLDGEQVEVEAEGLAAAAWQHELDHLNGVLIIDHLTPTRLITIRGQLKDLEEIAQRQER